MKLRSAHLATAAACLAGVSTLGCPAREPSPTADRAPTAERSSTAKRSPTAEPTAAEDSSPANDLLRELSKHDDGVVTITTGTEHFGKGLVTLSVHGDGKLEIVNLRVGKTTKYDGKLEPAEVEQLGIRFSKAGFTTLKTSGPPRTPGDTPVVFEISRAGKQLFRSELWHGDRYQQPGLDEILERNDAIVKEITNGELPY